MSTELGAAQGDFDPSIDPVLKHIFPPSFDQQLAEKALLAKFADELHTTLRGILGDRHVAAYRVSLPDGRTMVMYLEKTRAPYSGEGVTVHLANTDNVYMELRSMSYYVYSAVARDMHSQRMDISALESLKRILGWPRERIGSDTTS